MAGGISPLSRPVTASELRFLVALSSPTNDPDTPGFGSATNYWANIEPMGSAAQMADHVIGGTATFRVTFRSGVTVKPGDKVTHDGATYEVETVEAIPRARVTCKARAVS